MISRLSGVRFVLVGLEVSALVSVVVKWPILISISVVGRCALQLFFIWRSFESKYHYPLASTTTTQSIWKTRTSPSRGETYSLSTERQPPTIRRDHLPQYGKTTSHNTEKPPPFNNGPHTSFMERRAHLTHKTCFISLTHHLFALWFFSQELWPSTPSQIETRGKQNNRHYSSAERWLQASFREHDC